ncbi:hypothetical protein CVT26_003815 [Gymnopilus dilepis]|uniref:F-box domain-containing protein n=1 Tax=Gymnopilus dilepis TaxID=231916 RepID=A0A409YMC8_9AGAR|nr:hypothetical protein CVT26_003815 [Gymnopilus dilepis]
MFPLTRYSYHTLSVFEYFVLHLSPSALQHLLDWMDPNSLVLLSRTCKTLHGAYTDYARTVWNPAKIYGRWFARPWFFRRMLRRCGGIVSGSIVFNFFDRGRRKRNVMHIFLRSAGADELCGWFSEQGYASICGGYKPNDPLWHGLHCVKAVMPQGEEERGVLATYLFEKIVVGESGILEAFVAKLVVIDVDPVQYVLFDFDYTGEMNFLTADGAVSIFPYDTFVDRISYISWNGDKKFQATQASTRKHLRRGVTTISGGVTRMRSSFKTGQRRVLDEKCWFIPFQEKLFEFPGWPDSYYGECTPPIPFEVLYLSDIKHADLFRLKIAEPYIWRALLCDGLEGGEEDDDVELQ